MMIVYTPSNNGQTELDTIYIWEWGTSYLYEPSACEWIVPGTYEAFE